MASSTYNPSTEDQAAVNLVVKSVESCESDWHTTFCNKVERRYGAYRGLKQQAEDREVPSGWRSNVTQPFLINIVEGFIASLIENQPMWQVKPLPIPGQTLDQIEERIKNAENAQYLLQHDMNIDRFPVKQRDLIQQDLIAGYTVAKTYRLRQKKDIPYLEPGIDLVWDEMAGTIDLVNTYEQKHHEGVVVRDSPTWEPRDVRDFFFPGSARDIQTSPFIVDRTWATIDVLEDLQSQGVYENIEFVKLTGADEGQTVKTREQTLRGINRTKGLVEILEFWSKDDVITIANRQILLRKKANTFFTHGKYPFVVTSAIPEMFQIPGVSIVEGLAQMQDMLWTLQNTRLDSLRSLASPITLIRSDVRNADDFDFAPLAQWIVDDPNQVKTLEIDNTPATVTLQAEQILRGDLAQIMGGVPFASGGQSGTIDNQTATGVSIFANVAQQLLAARKQQYLWAYEIVGCHFLSIRQQSMREDEVIYVTKGDKQKPLNIDPMSIQGYFDVKLEMAAESMIRKEERAEWQSLLMAALQGAAPSMQMGAKLNIQKLWEQLFKSYDILDYEAYVTAMPPPQMGLPPQIGSPPAPDTGGGGNGVTNPELATQMGGANGNTSAVQQMDARGGM